MKLINSLQNKPRCVRIQILWISVVLVMIIIFFLWLIYLKSSLRFSEFDQQPPTQEEEKSIPSLFGTLKEDFLFLGKNLQAGVWGLIKSSEKKPKFEVEIIKP